MERISKTIPTRIMGILSALRSNPIHKTIGFLGAILIKNAIAIPVAVAKSRHGSIIPSLKNWSMTLIIRNIATNTTNQTSLFFITVVSFF
jgi:hypothetical protein